MRFLLLCAVATLSTQPSDSSGADTCSDTIAELQQALLRAAQDQTACNCSTHLNTRSRPPPLNKAQSAVLGTVLALLIIPCVVRFIRRQRIKVGSLIKNPHSLFFPKKKNQRQTCTYWHTFVPTHRADGGAVIAPLSLCGNTKLSISLFSACPSLKRNSSKHHTISKTFECNSSTTASS